MLIKSSCNNWKGEIDGKLSESLSSEEIAALSDILHMAGDTIMAYGMMPELTLEIKQRLLNSLHEFWGHMEGHIIDLLDNAIAQYALQTPLEGELASDMLFGIDLKTTLHSLLTKEEAKLAEEHLNEPFISSEWEEGADDDDNSILP